MTIYEKQKSMDPIRFCQSNKFILLSTFASATCFGLVRPAGDCRVKTEGGPCHHACNHQAGHCHPIRLPGAFLFVHIPNVEESYQKQHHKDYDHNLERICPVDVFALGVPLDILLGVTLHINETISAPGILFLEHRG